LKKQAKLLHVLKSKLFHTLFIATLAILLARCANIVSPEGGPRDKTPPVVEKCEPANPSVNFQGKTIRITFDEFVNVDDGLNKILISPPLKDEPDYHLRNKTLVIDFRDTLKPLTTYTIDFGKSITDITENNILPDFYYTFSTGPYLDSLEITGNVYNAFTNQPIPDAFVMLYLDNNDTIPFDSLPMRVKPRYVTRSEPNGEFIFRHLADGTFRLFALQDKSGDMLFNQPSEMIAYLDTLVHPWYSPPAIPDTLGSDTLQPAVPGHPPIGLAMFEQVDSVQSVLRTDIITDYHLQMIFTYPAKNLQIDWVNRDSLGQGLMEEINTRGDTIQLWFPSVTSDSVRLIVTAKNMEPDTVEASVVRKALTKKSKKDEPVRKPGLSMTTNLRSGLLNQYKSPLMVTISSPLVKFDLTGVLLIQGKDTTIAKLKTVDPLHRKFLVDNRWMEGKSYRLLIPDSVFLSFDSLSNDTMRYDLMTVWQRDLGSLILDVSMDKNPGNYIIQLVSGEKENLIEEQYITAPGKVKFNFLAPGKFKVKAILDRSQNHQWDSGNFIGKIQPEKIYYYPSVIEVRANWDVEEKLEL
jgi:hypothetical protein